MASIYIRSGKLPNHFLSTTDSAIQNVTGTNLGNMLFQQAVARTLWTPGNTLHPIGHGLNRHIIETINQNADILVLPLANQFRPEFGALLDIWADIIRHLKVKVVVVGVGCQTDLNYNTSSLTSIQRSVKNFVAAVLDRSASIGVRGELTLDYLNKLGFKDVDVIGCPSMFMYGEALPKPRVVTHFDVNTRLSVNISSYGEQAKHTTGLERVGNFISRATDTYGDLEYIPQEIRSLEDLISGRMSSTGEHSVIPGNTYKKIYLRNQVVTFVDPSTWIAHLRQRDFTFGTRLHGVIASLLAGTPAHLIAHDSRTLELARYHRVPHTDIRKFNAEIDPKFLYENSDYSEMVDGHLDRFKRYLFFLDKNGLPSTFASGDNGKSFDKIMSHTELASPISSLPVDRKKYECRRCSNEVARFRDEHRRNLYHKIIFSYWHLVSLIKREVNFMKINILKRSRE